uniref:WD-40 repeat-containing protein, putative n=1 Tax=Neospora caninum (strain Liverpool) TaxID=572307 RepID=A0A0F7UIT7_NEOCL|nr:TPA: WD-40 repeat-containing protein, putative [Neospora caninum Liverpool]
MTAGPEAAGTCKVRLTEKLIRSLRVTQVIDCGRTCEGGEDAQTQPRSLWQVTSADWSQDGTTVVLALCPSAKGDARWPPSTGAANVGNPREGRSDERCAKLLFFSAHTGSLTQIRETTWRNIDAVRFVQGGARKCLVACSDSRPAVVLWSLDDNVLPTHYSLPAAVVPHTGVDVHPTGDLFLASCLDGTVLLFHLDRAQALGHVRGSSSYPVSAFDCEGLVYACSLGNRKIHLFGCDDDAIDKEPAGQFSSFDLSPFLAPGSHITSLAFGPDEKTLLVCSNRAQVLLIDAFDGKKIHEYNPPQSSSPSMPFLPSSPLSARSSLSSRPCPPAYTPDGKFVLWGNPTAGEDAICVWKAIQSPVDGSAPASSGRPGEKKKGPDPLLVARVRSETPRERPGKKCGETPPAFDFVLFSRVHALMVTVAGGILSFWQPAAV